MALEKHYRYHNHCHLVPAATSPLPDRPFAGIPCSSALRRTADCGWPLPTAAGDRLVVKVASEEAPLAINII